MKCSFFFPFSRSLSLSLLLRLLSLCLLVSLSLPLAATDELLGCGGFVKSDVELDFSLVEIKLLTKQGNLKYRTDCAPNNGYFMIPLYDKGDFILTIEPPQGWSFEPSRAELQVDGHSDRCSRGEDIDFTFKGFTITGQVVSSGFTTGPAGVSLVLISDGKELQTVSSQQGGRYNFRKVLPGEYKKSIARR
uniref:BOS complex subunit NOMO1-like n=1 Tax=Myxine glutinosa TaxID=7769 RepID=UPI00358FD691